MTKPSIPVSTEEKAALLKGCKELNNMPKHTSLPWRYAERPQNVHPQFVILDSFGNEVVFLACHQQAMKIYGANLKREQGILGLIVRAVNNHYNLLEACIDAIVELEYHDWHNTSTHNLLKQAIAKATGKE